MRASGGRPAPYPARGPGGAPAARSAHGRPTKSDAAEPSDHTTRREKAGARNAPPPPQPRLPGDRPQAPGDAPGQRRLQVQPDVRALPRQRGPDADRGDAARGRRHGARVPAWLGREDARHHRRRPRAEPALPLPRHRSAETGRAGDGPLQPHDPQPAGAGGSRRLPRRPARRSGGLAARAISRTTSTASAAKGVFSGEHRRAAEAERARLRQGRIPGSCSTWSTTRRGRRCRRRRCRSRTRTAGISAPRTASSSTGSSRSPTCRSSASASTLISKGQFDAYMTAAPGQLPRREPRRRDVPHAALGGLAGLRLRLRLQPDARAGRCASTAGRATRLADLLGRDLDGRPIVVADHCFGCTAGQGSSCGGLRSRTLGDPSQRRMTKSRLRCPDCDRRADRGVLRLRPRRATSASTTSRQQQAAIEAYYQAHPLQTRCDLFRSTSR